MKYRVYSKKDNTDITNDFHWVLEPNGKLYMLHLDDLESADDFARVDFEDSPAVSHAHWIVKPGLLVDNYECSACQTYERFETPHCPKCGSVMDGEHEYA